MISQSHHHSFPTLRNHRSKNRCLLKCHNKIYQILTENSLFFSNFFKFFFLFRSFIILLSGCNGSLSSLDNEYCSGSLHFPFCQVSLESFFILNRLEKYFIFLKFEMSNLFRFNFCLLINNKSKENKNVNTRI